MNRRQFLTSTACAVAGAALLPVPVAKFTMADFEALIEAEIAQLRRDIAVEFRIPGFDRRGNPVAAQPSVRRFS